MLAGMKSEQVAGFVSESVAGFSGIRSLTLLYDIEPAKSAGFFVDAISSAPFRMLEDVRSLSHALEEHGSLVKDAARPTPDFRSDKFHLLLLISGITIRRCRKRLDSIDATTLLPRADKVGECRRSGSRRTT
jgi:hypothetical protein